jgi:hypothetical protein
MIRLAAGLSLLLVGGSEVGASQQDQRFAQITVRQRIVIRVPEGDRRVVPAGTSLIRWREIGGPRCISARNIVGATVSQNNVDLIMRDSRRIRARLGQRCPGLAYYRGFYVNATADGNICADRDVIRSRAGGECPISEFRGLQPMRPR